MWDIEIQWKVQQYEPFDPITYCVALSPDNQHVICGSSNTISYWEVSSGKLLYQYPDSGLGISFTPDGRSFVYRDPWGDLKRREVKTGKCTMTFEPSTSLLTTAPFQEVAISKDGKTLACIDKMGSVNLWEMQTKKCNRTFHPSNSIATCTVFQPREMKAIIGYWEGSIRVWNYPHHDRARVLQTHTSPIWRLAPSPDGRRLLSGSEDGKITLWDLKKQKALESHARHAAKIIALSFRSDGLQAYSCDISGKVCVWNI